MARKKRKLAPTKRPVPAYMTSFADMMTLLLTFFILLVAFAEEQRAELVAAGTGSFVSAINTLGLPGLLPGGRNPVDVGTLPPNFTIPPRHVELNPEGALLNESLLTPPEDRLRRSAIDYLRRRRAVGFSTSVVFRPGTAELAPESAKPLDEVAELAQSSLCHITVQCHVSGPGDGWPLSGLRAAAVARRLHERSAIPYARITLAGFGRFQPVAEGPGAGQPNDRVRILLSPDSPL